MGLGVLARLPVPLCGQELDRLLDVLRLAAIGDEDGVVGRYDDEVRHAERRNEPSAGPDEGVCGVEPDTPADGSGRF